MWKQMNYFENEKKNQGKMPLYWKKLRKTWNYDNWIIQSDRLNLKKIFYREGGNIKLFHCSMSKKWSQFLMKKSKRFRDKKTKTIYF